MVDPQVLDTSDGFHTALHAIEDICHRGDSEIAGMVSALMNRSHILEYIFSGMLHPPVRPHVLSAQHQPFRFPVVDENSYEKLTEWVISGFPTPTTSKIVDTTSMKLLQRLSSSLLFAEYPSAADAPPDLRVFWKKVELSFNVLKELEEHVNASFKSGNISPTSYKRGKQTVKNCRVDPLPFDSMGITVPTTDAEVRDACVGILAQLQGILEVRALTISGLHRTKQPQYYLLILRQPLMSEVFKSSYGKANLPSESVFSPTTRKAVVGPDQSQSSAFPMIQPMKAALYFDDVEGFGEWSILLSTRAQKDLRDYKRADGAIFRIIMKKVKWGSILQASSFNRYNYY
jgi:hypothetical protein